VPVPHCSHWHFSLLLAGNFLLPDSRSSGRTHPCAMQSIFFRQLLFFWVYYSADTIMFWFFLRKRTDPSISLQVCATDTQLPFTALRTRIERSHLYGWPPAHPGRHLRFLMDSHVDPGHRPARYRRARILSYHTGAPIGVSPEAHHGRVGHGPLNRPAPAMITFGVPTLGRRPSPPRRVF